MSLLGAFNIGSTGLVAQAMRLNITASNVANAESVAGPDGRTYRARQVMFAPIPVENTKGAGVQVVDIVESKEPLRQEYKPFHPMADNNGYVQMPNVNPVEGIPPVSSCLKPSISVVNKRKVSYGSDF
jgi:flagellar basal-body rod protein FlgC